MKQLTYKQMRTIGYSVAKSALKVMPEAVKRSKVALNYRLAAYINKDKTSQKAFRECDHLGTEGFWAGVREALKERSFYTTPIFTNEFQVKEMQEFPERYGMERSK